MKPAWDKLADTFKDSSSVTVADVDCTAAGESICQKIGVSGYPTIKYWMADDPKPKDYSGSRDFDGLKKFTEETFKAGCNIDTEENCNDKQKEDIAKFKGMDLEALKKEIDELTNKAKEMHEERFAYIAESKRKIKEFKNAEVAQQNIQGIAAKFIEKLEPPKEKEEEPEDADKKDEL